MKILAIVAFVASIAAFVGAQYFISLIKNDLAAAVPALVLMFAWYIQSLTSWDAWNMGPAPSEGKSK